ncbi:MAG: S9 family peptidase [Thermomicrobiales bacterium]
MNATKHTIEARDLYHLEIAHTVAVSPDGQWAAFTVLRPDEATNRNQYDLLIVPVDGTGSPQPLVQGGSHDPAPSWSLCSQHLAYLADHEGVIQVWTIERASGKTRRVTHSTVNVSNPLWSPDSAHIAWVASVPSVAAPAGPTGGSDLGGQPRVILRARYKFDGMGWFGQSRSQLFVSTLDMPEANARQLTYEPAGISQPIWAAERGTSIGGPAWSPNGSQLAYTTSTNEDEELDSRCDVWTVDIATGDRTRITPNDGLYGCPAWSPDGTRLAVVGARLPKRGGSNSLIWTVPAGGGELTLASQADICAGALLLADAGAPTRVQPQWIGDWIYFSAGFEGTVQIFRTPSAGGQPEMVTTQQHALGSWSIDRGGTTLVYAATTASSPGQVFCQRLDTLEAPHPLTALNYEILSTVALAEPESFWTTSTDGSETRVQGWILKPPDFDETKTYPLILQVHGGPHCAYGASWYLEFQYLVAHGYVIVFSNPRGSSNYGEEFATSIYLDWGVKPMADVLAALDYAIDHVAIDPERIYVAGGSYGGYLVNWIVTHTDRFRAAVTGRCVSDLQTLALASDNGTLWMAEYFGGMPWEMPEVYESGSPIRHIANAVTPLLIEHQEQDMRCTMDQAEQMYNALRFLGVETEMVIYPGESHGMSRGGRPSHRVDRLERILDWFERHGGSG